MSASKRGLSSSSPRSRAASRRSLVQAIRADDSSRPVNLGRPRGRSAMRVLVAGASGFVGLRLTAALAPAGPQVVAMTRHPDRYRGAGVPVFGDVHDPGTLGPALDGCEAAYYLVHSLADADFARKDTVA